MGRIRRCIDPDERREGILDVAEALFLRDGVAATSMSAIAARLGGSKATLYNYFDSKADIFSAYVQRRCRWQEDAVCEVLPGELPEEALQRVGRAFLTHVLDKKTVRSLAVIAAESDREPGLGQIFYDMGPRQGMQRLAGFLSVLESLRVLDTEADPLSAAQDLLSLLLSRVQIARLCNAIPPLTPAEIDEHAARAVRTFLRAFPAKP